MNNTLVQINNWFKEAVPEPTKDKQRVQMGVHYEEVSEMLESISETSNSHYRTQITATFQSLRILSDSMKKNPDFDLVVKDRDELLDSLCDQIVTAVGVAHMNGFDILGAIQEVSNSNWSKFVDGKPVFDDNGKISKGPKYFKPNLSKFLGTNPVKSEPEVA